MARKLLVPVFPSERFYDAVVGAAELVARDGGLIVFAFTRAVRPPLYYEKEPSERPSLEEADPGEVDALEQEGMRAEQVAALDDARELLRERGIGDAQIDYVFADYDVPAAEAIAAEALAGGYDGVVLARGYFIASPTLDGSLPEEVAAAIQELEGEVGLVVA